MVEVYIAEHMADSMLLERFQIIRYSILSHLLSRNEMKLAIACDSDRYDDREVINHCMMDIWQRSK